MDILATELCNLEILREGKIDVKAPGFVSRNFRRLEIVLDVPLSSPRALRRSLQEIRLKAPEKLQVLY